MTIIIQKVSLTKSINRGGGGRGVFDTGRWGLRTQRQFPQDQPKGPWLHAEWKSNVSQQEVRAEFIHDMRDTDGTFRRLRKKKRVSQPCSGSKGFY